MTTYADIDGLLKRAAKSVDDRHAGVTKLAQLVDRLSAALRAERAARVADHAEAARADALAQAIAECDDESRRVPHKYQRASFQAGAVAK